MKTVVLANPVRSAIGTLGGSLSSLGVVGIGGQVVRACIGNDSEVKNSIDEVFMGNVLQAGVGQNPARQVAIKAGLDISIPASTVNTVCGSGLHSVGLAFNSILAGQSELVLAGGMESMSNAPYILKKARNGYRMGHGELLDEMVLGGLTCPFNDYHMGVTAENIAEKYGIDRLSQDKFAIESQERAFEARKEGIFDSEIVPITIKTKKEEISFSSDEYIREGASLEKLSKLRPAFKADGSVTAGNSSGVNDGAASVLVAEQERAKSLGLDIKGVVRGFVLHGLEPELMGLGPVGAIRKLLKKTKVSLDDIDIFELNEAFAVQSLAVVKELEVDPKKVNVYGGAIALGHPIGASGTRVLVTLLNAMEKKNKKLGIASLCIGAGMGIAMLIERRSF